MRILQVNKFFYPKGGADKYFIDLTSSLKAAGHETAVFAMADERNLPSTDDKYFVTPVKFTSPHLKDKLKILGRTVYSQEAKRLFTRELNDFKPDIVHVHNIYHEISPSILVAAKAKNIPIIMHLHDYKLICPNYRMFVKNQICRKCLDRKSYWPCVSNNCYESHQKSLLATIEMTIHHKWLHIYEKNIDLLIAPSDYIRQLILESGWSADKVITLYNPAPKISEKLLEGNNKLLSKNVAASEDYLLYFGRLVPEKGICDLAQAVKKANKFLHIAGVGPEETNIRRQFASEIQNGQIKILGQLSGQALKDEITFARAVVFPSIWPENMPLALLEALAGGQIVIASRVGGLPEIIRDRDNGFLFTAGNIGSLELAIKTVYELSPSALETMKLKAIESAKSLDPDDHLDKILKIYSKLAKKSG